MFEIKTKILELKQLELVLDELGLVGVIEIKKKKGQINYLKQIEEFKKDYGIETDDVITLVDMYFANQFSKEYVGKGIFD